MDEHLEQMAKASRNFGLLYPHQPLLSLFGALSEVTVFTNPNASLVQAGQFGEVLAEELITRSGLTVHGTSQFDRLNALTRNQFLVSAIRDDFDLLRRERNDAAHEYVFDTTRALKAVRTCYKLGLWFHDALSGRRTVAAFVPPAEPTAYAQVTDPAELEELHEALKGHRRDLTEARTRLTEKESGLEAERRARQEAERLIAGAEAQRTGMAATIEQLHAEVARLREEQSQSYELLRREPRKVDSAVRDTIMHRAQRPAPLNEVQAREIIDGMLRAAGWVIQDRADIKPNADTGVAVREFTLATGRADYVLYVDGKIVGVVEAKREGDSLSSALAQNDRYASGVAKEYSLAVWRRDEPFAFRYATSGAETYFVNRLDPDHRSRDVFTFHRPETISRWMRRAEQAPDTPTFRAGLRTLPTLETNGLRTAQFDAISGLEISLSQDRPRALIQMATGAGKTFMAVAEAYRLLKYADAGRVLFLVDRNNLSRQAQDEFRNFSTPDDSRKFADIYNVDRLGSAGLQDSSAVVICTIQRMHRLLTGSGLSDNDAAEDASDSSSFTHDEDSYETDLPIEVGYNPAVPIESFDLIVIDECHRSIYGKWRGVLEYFDAHLVGLTATPVPQTFGFFHRNLVSEYTREQAVADGVNVDFDVARLGTSLREDGGATIESGTTVRVMDRKTRTERLHALDDDLTYTTPQIGRTVVNVDEIRLVLSEFRDNWHSWFPDRTELPKTLIFAVGENHAEDVLAQVKEVFGRGDEFAKKITYKSRAAGQDPDELIRELRTSPRLRVAVTVDMIATGTDIRALECVIFLRAVRSAVLFEQMKGRGARTICPTELRDVTPGSGETTRKSRFILFDAVGVTQSPLVDARPLAPAGGPRRVALEQLLDKAGTKAISAEETEVLAGRLARLTHQLNEEERGELQRHAGGTPLTEIASRLMRAADMDRQEEVTEAHGPAAARQLLIDALTPLTDNPELRQRILEIRRDKDYVYDETNEVTSTGLELVPRAKRARNEISSWREFLEQRRDQIAAIEIALSSPRSTSQEESWTALRVLADEIHRPQYAWTPESLWGYYEDLAVARRRGGRKADIPDLISLIRYELGADHELHLYREQVEERFAAWLLRQEQAGADFTDDQMWWLEHIRDVIASDVGIAPQDLGGEPFVAKGGGRGFKHAFGERDVRTLLDELNRELA